MSLRAMLWALEDAPVEDKTALLVLIALAERADEDGDNAWPSVAWLAHRARCSERTVQRALMTLRDEGLIAEGDQRLIEHLRADRRPVVYDLEMGRGDTWRTHGDDLVERGDILTPPGFDMAERGDIHGTNGVTTVSPNTSIEPRERTTPLPPTVTPSRFDEFWETVLRKEDKAVCRKKWDALLKRKVDPDLVITASRRYAEQVRAERRETRYIKKPSNWLTAEPWEDDPPTVTSNGSPPSWMTWDGAVPAHR